MRTQTLTPNRSLDYYALTNFGINPTISRHGIAQARLALLIWLNEMVLFVICLSVFRLQWNPIAPSKRRDICSKTRVVIIITLMTDLGWNKLFLGMGQLPVNMKKEMESPRSFRVIDKVINTHSRVINLTPVGLLTLLNMKVALVPFNFLSWAICETWIT